MAAVFSMAVACYAIKQRGTAGAWAMAATMIAAGLWSAGYGLEIASVRLEDKVLWAKLEYLGICVIPYSLLVFGVRYSGRQFRAAAWVALAVVPAVTLGLVLTNELHGWIWNSIEIASNGMFLLLGHGPAFWVYWVYSYLLIITGLLLILNVLFHSRRLYVKQGAIILLGLLTPWLGNTLYVLNVLPGDGSFDPTPVCFTFTGVLIALGLFRYQLLDIVPVARNALVEEMQDGMIVLDGRGRILDVNPAAASLLSLPIAEAVGRRAEDVVFGWDSDDFLMQAEVRAGSPERDYELTTTLLHGKSHSKNGKGNRGPEAVILFRDITQRRSSEMKLRESEDRYRRLVELSPDAIVVHSGGKIEYINRVGASILAATEPHVLIGRALADFIHPDFLESAIARGKRIYAGNRTEPVELKFVRADGTVIDVETSSMPISYDAKPAAQMVFREITERKSLENALAHQAFHDPLTNLPNRGLFLDRLDDALTPKSRTDSRRVGVLYMDLDGFKLVNDSLGHEYGDSLLIAVAGRLQASVRPNDLVARMGGDEFTVMLEDLWSVTEAEQVADRITNALSTPFVIKGQEVYITCSIGIVIGKAGEYKTSGILRDADSAMYEAKREKETRYKVFESNMADPANQHLELKNDLRLALNRSEFVVYYQPKVAINTGEITGLEALLRWQHPSRGLLLPKDFLEIAESTGLMPELGSQVIRSVLRQMALWKDDLSANPGFRVAVNLSVRQLRRPEVADEILAMIRGSAVDSSALEVEITEDAFIEPESPAIGVLQRLHVAGIKLSVDDFGTGYSSLSRLKLIPADTIKIDRSLTMELDGTGDGETIVAGIIDLSHALGKSVVAEGVENSEQLSKLRSLGCDLVQGNFLWTALPSEEILPLLNRRDSA